MSKLLVEKKMYRVVALPGEGIGPEVLSAALRVLMNLAELNGFIVQIDYGLIGEPAKEKLGCYFPPETAELCQGSDGIVFGAVACGGLLELRKHFDFFANLRPVETSHSLLKRSSLRPDCVRDLDLLFVRELVSGIYFGPGGRSEDEWGSYGYHTMRYHDWEIRRIARVALEQAQSRRGLVTVAHKENALPYLPWSRLVREEAIAFPGVRVEPMLVDNLAMQLVKAPKQFDVVLAGNLFGDILSDIAGALVGSIGLLASMSLNTEGLGLYEAIHGTAPDIAGQGIANPLGMIGAISLMLAQWGEHKAVETLHKAQEAVLAKGYRTADLMDRDSSERLVGTEQLANLLIQSQSELYTCSGVK